MNWGVVCHGPGGPDLLKLEEFPARPVGQGELRIAIHAAGVNFPDLLTSGGKYQIKPPLPFILGMEASGVVTEVGDGLPTSHIGQRVMCWAWHGCYAEEIVVPAADTLPLPDGFSFAEGAAFMVATSTATNALLQRGHLGAGEVLVVHGAAGGVGLAAVEVGKRLGATVIATASTADKLALAAGRGADHLIEYTSQDFSAAVMDITAGAGADVIFDTVGGDVFDRSLRCIGWGGRLLVVGFAGGRIPEMRTNQALLKCCSVVGVRALEHTRRKPEEGAAYREWMLSQAASGHLRPYVSDIFPLADFRAALRQIETRKARGRIVLEVRPG
ncbi:zinc-binding dehydrogenase [Bordetella petrii]|nr:zinc-binding dehydrogenase [Bordetella petrii]